MTPEQAQAVLDALKNGDAEAALSLIEEMLMTAIAGESYDDPAEEALAEAPAEEPAEDPEESQEMAAASAEAVAEAEPEAMATLSALCDLVGASSPTEAIAMLSAQREAEQAKAAEAEAISRRALVADLVKLGAETPVTAWADAERKTPVARLSAEPLADLRSRVQALREAKAPALRPPRTHSVAGGSAREIQFSSRELEQIKARGWTVEEARQRAAQAIRRA